MKKLPLFCTVASLAQCKFQLVLNIEKASNIITGNRNLWHSWLCKQRVGEFCVL